MTNPGVGERRGRHIIITPHSEGAMSEKAAILAELDALRQRVERWEEPKPKSKAEPRRPRDRGGAVQVRLEQVRNDLGLNVTDWHQHLCDATGFRVSRSAVNNYHIGTYPARLPYLQAVSAAFGVDLGWLVSGRGEP